MLIQVTGFHPALTQHSGLVIVITLTAIGIHVDDTAAFHLLHMVDHILRVIGLDLRRIGGAAMLAVPGFDLGRCCAANGVVSYRLRLGGFVILLFVMCFGGVLRAINRTLVCMVVVDIQTGRAHRGVGGWFVIVGVGHDWHPFWLAIMANTLGGSRFQTLARALSFRHGQVMTDAAHPATAYKILTADQWAQFQADGVFYGAPVDLADGYIHLSAADQLAGTLNKHFGGQTGLVIAEIDLAALASILKWEVSRGDALFPHIYGPLPMTAVVSTRAA
jgi:uncharacterized protein (DUF952 family)